MFWHFSSINFWISNLQPISKYLYTALKLQNKAIRIINFTNYHEPSGILYKNSKILKISENITLQNFMYLHDSLRGILPFLLHHNLIFLQDLHHHNMRISSLFQIQLPNANTQKYGIESIIFQARYAWNSFENKLFDLKFTMKSRGFCKKVITKYFINGYKI